VAKAEANRGRMAGRKLRLACEMLEARVLLSFSAPVSYNIGTQADGFVPNAAPINVVTGDFNGDGKLDLIVAHKADNSIYFLAGNGNGTFQPAVQYPVGNAIEGRVFVGDFNGDGKLDLFLPGDINSANHPIILLGNGNGTFQPRIDSSSFAVTGTYPRGWSVGDFNGDGKLDIACTLPSDSADSGAYMVLLGNGDGTFQPGIVGPAVLHYSRWSAIGDFNGDGKLDLAIADGQGSGDTVGTAELTILLGNGDGTFRLGGHYASPQTPNGEKNIVVNPEDVVVADLNHDGKLDAIVSDYDHNINIFMGNGDGTFQPAVGIDGLEYPRDVIVADVNGDGIPDLVTDNVGVGPGGSAFAQEGSVPGSVAVLLGNGDGTFQAPIQYNGIYYPGWTALGDFNGDGLPDLATTQVSNGHSVNVSLNESPTRSPTLVTPAYATPNPLLVNTVLGSTANLTVLGADAAGENTLTYTWSIVSIPSGATNPTFSLNGNSAAKNTTVTFAQLGLYGFGVTITDPGGASTTSAVQVLVTVNQAPTVVTAAKATPSPVTGTSTALSVFGADDGGEFDLTYTWATTGTPPAPVTFGANGTHDAQNTTATFTKAGTYSFVVTITDLENRSITSSVNVTVNTMLTTIAVAPGNPSVPTGGTQQFTATALDQFGTALASQPAFTWTVSSGGTISSTGLFTAGAAAGGPIAITATSGGVTGVANVTVTGSGNTFISTVYSLAGDGKVAYFGNNGGGQAGWDTAHDIAVGNATDYTMANRVNWAASGYSTNVFISRGFLAFDTSALPANAVITNATLGVFVTGTSDSVNDGNDFVTVTQGLQASSTSLTGNDYNKAGNAIDNPIEGSNRIDITGITVNSYVLWTLNANGLSWIKPGGISQFAVREGHDVLDLWSYQNGQADVISAYMSEQPGTAQDPYLQITYTIPAPTIASVYTGPSPVMWPRLLTVTAAGVTDPDGSIAGVAFYRESNNTPGLQTGAGGDTFVGNAVPNGANTWTYTADVTNWQPGQPTIYALATDNQGATSAIGVAAPSAQAGILPLGDANGDYKVDSSDYILIDNGFNLHLTGWANGDFNNDGVINGEDYTLIDNTFNTQGSGTVSLIASSTDQAAKTPDAAISSRNQGTSTGSMAVEPATPDVGDATDLRKRLRDIWASLEENNS
jgi:hypothetical protein